MGMGVGTRTGVEAGARTGDMTLGGTGMGIPPCGIGGSGRFFVGGENMGVVGGG